MHGTRKWLFGVMDPSHAWHPHISRIKFPTDKSTFITLHHSSQSLSMDQSAKIVIIGSGLFGLATAKQLASEGYRNILVVDRHMAPVIHSIDPLCCTKC